MRVRMNVDLSHNGADLARDSEVDLPGDEARVLVERGQATTIPGDPKLPPPTATLRVRMKTSFRHRGRALHAGKEVVLPKDEAKVFINGGHAELVEPQDTDGKVYVRVRMDKEAAVDGKPAKVGEERVLPEDEARALIDSGRATDLGVVEAPSVGVPAIVRVKMTTDLTHRGRQLAQDAEYDLPEDQAQLLVDVGHAEPIDGLRSTPEAQGPSAAGVGGAVASGHSTATARGGSERATDPKVPAKLRGTTTSTTAPKPSPKNLPSGAKTAAKIAGKSGKGRK